MEDHLVEMYPLPGERRGGSWDAFCICEWESGADDEDTVYYLVRNHVYHVHHIHWRDPKFQDAVMFL